MWCRCTSTTCSFARAWKSRIRISDTEQQEPAYFPTKADMVALSGRTVEEALCEDWGGSREGSRNKIQTWAFSVAALYKPPSTGRGGYAKYPLRFGDSWPHGPLDTHHPFPDRRATLRHPNFWRPNQIIVPLKKSKGHSQFPFNRNDERNQRERELNKWWRCGLYPCRVNVGTRSVDSCLWALSWKEGMRTWSIHVFASSAMSTNWGPVFFFLKKNIVAQFWDTLYNVISV